MSVTLKTIRTVCLALAVMVAAGLVAASQGFAGDKTYHIRFSTWHVPTGADVQKLWIPVLEEMKKKSNGRLTYTMYAGGALGKGPDHYDIVKTGLSDMGYATLSWTPGRFPLSDTLSAPVTCPSKIKASIAGRAMYDKILSPEFKGIHVLEINNCVMAHLWTTKPVRTMEDLKGMKIRSPGGLQTKAIQALGATPVFMPLGDVYLSMETGVIDGVVTCPALVRAFKLHEVSKYCVPTSFGCVSEGLFMNQKFYDKLPDDLKAIVDDVGGNAYQVAGMFDETWYNFVMAQIRKTVKVDPLSADEQARWDNAFRDMLVNWSDELEKKGLPARKALTMFKEELGKVGVDFNACPEF